MKSAKQTNPNLGMPLYHQYFYANSCYALQVDIFKGIYQAGSNASLGNGDAMFQALVSAR